MALEYKKYTTDELTVKYNPKLCIHAAECVKGLPKVFNPRRKPWIEAGNASPDQIIEVIEKCPTGALKYESIDENKNEKHDHKAEIIIKRNGPLYFKGDIEIIDSNGEIISSTGRAALCRCGASKNKPFCDNSHLEINFNG